MSDAPPSQTFPTPEINIVNPQTDEDFFAIGRILAKRNSTCLKTQTAALIVDKYGNIISWGVNMCCPQNQLYGMPVTECPRMDTMTLTSYALCMPLHAEIVACLNAFGISSVDRKSLWHFTGFTKRLKEYEGFFKSRGAVLYLIGHFVVCEECSAFLKTLDIEEIKFDDISGGETRQNYQRQGLDQVPPGAVDVSGCIMRGVVTVSIQPRKIVAFCRRHNIERGRVKRLLPAPSNLYIVPVPKGDEKERAKRFRSDPAVEDAEILLTQSA